MNDVFTLRSQAVPDGTRVVGFKGTEGISKPYVFEIYLTIPSEESNEFSPESGIGLKASLVVDREDDRPPFVFHGIFAALELVHELGGRALVRATLVPHLWYLTQSVHSRIFTGQSIPDIISYILEDAGIRAGDYSLNLSGDYKPEEHVCQYHETDLDFISRWMEREGMYYFFEHGERGEKLIIADSKSCHEALAPGAIRFFSLTDDDVSARACLDAFTCRAQSLPNRVRIKDYDYANPALDVSAIGKVLRTGVGEINVHGGRFTPEEGKRLAQLRAEELLCRRVVFQGSGTTFHLRSGYTFELEDHPRASFDAKYLALDVEHCGNQGASTRELRRLTGLDTDEVYRVEVTAIPESVQFRAGQKTPWPRIYGFEHGVIDGAAESDYAQIDDHGRYRVKFSFDESDLRNGKASTWVRMLQPHGGGIEGRHFPLRKRTEVVFTFLGGDPDRPVIAGVVPNAHKPSPVTAGNHTKNVIQTGGKNRIEIEDKAGFQRITLSTPHADTFIRMGSPNAQHELIVNTAKNALLNTGASWDVWVGKHLNEKVTGNTHETYTGEHHTESSDWRVVTIGGFYEQICRSGLRRTHDGVSVTTVTGDVSEEFQANHSWVMGGNQATAVSGSQILTVGGSVTQVCGPGTFTYGPMHLTSGPITITAPSVMVNGAAVTTKSGVIKSFTPASIEAYGSKNAAGAQKADLAGISMSVTGMSMSATGVKLDTVATSVSTSGMKVDLNMCHIKNGGADIRTAAMRTSMNGLDKWLGALLLVG